MQDCIKLGPYYADITSPGLGFYEIEGSGSIDCSTGVRERYSYGEPEANDSSEIMGSFDFQAGPLIGGPKNLGLHSLIQFSLTGVAKGQKIQVCMALKK